MLYGALIIVEKNKNKEREIEEAIQNGIRLYQKHNPDVPALECVAYVHPRLYAELDGKTYSIEVIGNRVVPYPLLWICRKGESDDSSNRRDSH